MSKITLTLYQFLAQCWAPFGSPWLRLSPTFVDFRRFWTLLSEQRHQSSPGRGPGRLWEAFWLEFESIVYRFWFRKCQNSMIFQDNNLLIFAKNEASEISRNSRLSKSAWPRPLLFMFLSFLGSLGESTGLEGVLGFFKKHFFKWYVQRGMVILYIGFDSKSVIIG